MALAKTDEVFDEVLYRPAVVKAFAWLPRWWLCDLARLSVTLDDRWRTGYWHEDAIVPGGACEVCGRRAAIHVIGGRSDDEILEPVGDDAMLTERSVLDDREIHTCGWCHLRGRILTEGDLTRGDGGRQGRLSRLEMALAGPRVGYPPISNRRTVAHITTIRLELDHYDPPARNRRSASSCQRSIDWTNAPMVLPLSSVCIPEHPSIMPPAWASRSLGKSWFERPISGEAA